MEMQNIRNDTALFNEIFKSHKDGYIRFVNSYIRNPFDAEDIVMDSFMTFWEKRNELKNVSNVYAYILTIIKNKTINYLEHIQITEQAKEHIREHQARELEFRISTLRACDPEALFSEDVRMIIKNTLKLLSEKDVMIFKLSWIENKTNKEIAEIMGLNVKTIEAHIT
ncbi:MAG: RNA polymerase sigma-70 factor, partial [Dysgonamonadaceae bacterium]|nr:RNA polymerase sigma-70 factor [Dysgonamonadaceae bacterium]